MARRGFVCPNCRTWFEGEGNHPRCPACGTRASPRDLLDARHQAPAERGPVQAPGAGYGAAQGYEERAPREPSRPGSEETESSAGNWIGIVVGVIAFLILLGAQICSAVEDSSNSALGPPAPPPRYEAPAAASHASAGLAASSFEESLER